MPLRSPDGSALVSGPVILNWPTGSLTPKPKEEANPPTTTMVFWVRVAPRGQKVDELEEVTVAQAYVGYVHPSYAPSGAGNRWSCSCLHGRSQAENGVLVGSPIVNLRARGGPECVSQRRRWRGRGARRTPSLRTRRRSGGAREEGA